eukprot:SAG31_NODE_5007_length_2806_cov_2.299224_3_plen_390_part_00
MFQNISLYLIISQALLKADGCAGDARECDQTIFKQYVARRVEEAALNDRGADPTCARAVTDLELRSYRGTIDSYRPLRAAPPNVVPKPPPLPQARMTVADLDAAGNMRWDVFENLARKRADSRTLAPAPTSIARMTNQTFVRPLQLQGGCVSHRHVLEIVCEFNGRSRGACADDCPQTSQAVEAVVECSDSRLHRGDGAEPMQSSVELHQAASSLVNSTAEPLSSPGSSGSEPDIGIANQTDVPVDSAALSTKANTALRAAVAAEQLWLQTKGCAEQSEAIQWFMAAAVWMSRLLYSNFTQHSAIKSALRQKLADVAAKLENLHRYSSRVDWALALAAVKSAIGALAPADLSSIPFLDAPPAIGVGQKLKINATTGQGTGVHHGSVLIN